MVQITVMANSLLRHACHRFVLEAHQQAPYVSVALGNLREGLSHRVLVQLAVVLSKVVGVPTSSPEAF